MFYVDEKNITKGELDRHSLYFSDSEIVENKLSFHNNTYVYKCYFGRHRIISQFNSRSLISTSKQINVRTHIFISKL